MNTTHYTITNNIIMAEALTAHTVAVALNTPGVETGNRRP